MKIKYIKIKRDIINTMKIKTSKIIFLSIFFMFFNMGHTINALNYSIGLQINEETNQLLAKEGGSKKSASKKSASKKSASKKSASKKSGSKKSGSKKSGSKKSASKKNLSKEKKSSINKVENNQNAIKEAAKERYEIWKKNKKKNKI